MPMYIQAGPNDPSGMKKAPIIAPMSTKYLIAQNL